MWVEYMLYVSEHTSLSYIEVKDLNIFEFFKILTIVDERNSKNRRGSKRDKRPS